IKSISNLAAILIRLKIYIRSQIWSSSAAIVKTSAVKLKPLNISTTKIRKQAVQTIKTPTQ
ncbi:hypothetical protein, partial [Campylobacter sp.]|uniref:hypothetical protein n=1 Tax=Campylobacter sp. TaxID=205 RepID=UPI00361CE00E